MVQHTVKRIQFMTVGEYIHCVAVGSDDLYLVVAEAERRRDAAWGVRRELRTRTNLVTPSHLTAQLNKECR